MAEEKPNNLNVWDKVKNTDPTYTKKATLQGHTFTSINATYMVKQATELWGPIGGDWGYHIQEERVDTGAPVFNDAGEVIGHNLTHTVKLELWVNIGVTRHSVTHFGHTPMVYYSYNNNRFITDGEAPKKSLTDALKKCLSMFGFSADIFLGLYDDEAYVQEARAAAEEQKDESAVEDNIKKREEYDKWLLEHVNFLQSATSLHELEVLFKTGVRKCTRRNDKGGIVQLTKAKDKRKEELENPPKEKK